jgi:hypothetical protein
MDLLSVDNCNRENFRGNLIRVEHSLEKISRPLMEFIGVMCHFLTNSINSHVETTQRLLHKLSKLKPFDMNFLLVIEATLSSPVRGHTPCDLIIILKYPRRKKKSMLTFELHLIKTDQVLISPDDQDLTCSICSQSMRPKDSSLGTFLRLLYAQICKVFSI